MTQSKDNLIRNVLFQEEFKNGVSYVVSEYDWCIVFKNRYF